MSNVKNKRFKQLNGFTLLEVIVALGIIMSVSGIALASYFNFNQSQLLETNTNELIANLELAKKKAIAADKAGLISGGTDYASCTLENYKLVINSATQYALNARVCDNSGSCPLASGCLDIPLSTYSTANSVALSPTSGSVAFASQTGQKTGLSSLTLTHINTNATKTVAVSAEGIIE